jgi:hypothetical protein
VANPSGSKLALSQNAQSNNLVQKKQVKSPFVFQLCTTTLIRPRLPLNVLVVVTPFTVLLIVTVEPLLLDFTETEDETEPETDAAVAPVVPTSRMVKAAMDKYDILSSSPFVCRLRRLTVFPR